MVFLKDNLKIVKRGELVGLDIPIWIVSARSSNREIFVADTLRRMVTENKYTEILLYQRDGPPVWLDHTFTKEEIDHVEQFKRLKNCRAAMDGSAVLVWGLHDVWIIYGGK